MSIQHTKTISPSLQNIKDFTPVLKVGNDYFVNGIGGDFIPGKGASITDATATAQDILEGKTAYNNSGKVTGTYTPLNTTDATATADDILQGKTAYGSKGKLYGTYIPRASSGTSFYKCSAVSSGGVQGQTLVMQGTEMFSGSTKEFTFTLQDASKTGKERTWKSSDGSYRLLNKQDEQQASGDHIWYIIYEYSGGATDNIWTSINCPNSTADNPWDMTQLVCNEDGMSYEITWTVSQGSSGSPSWSGYKAVLTGGKYTFLNTVTQGLTYTSVTPVVGGIYTEDALGRVSSLYTGISQEGLILYDSLIDHGQPELGNSYLQKVGVTYKEENGIPAAYFIGTNYNTSYIKYPIQTELVGASPCTISFWCKPENTTNKCAVYIGTFKGNGSGQALQALCTPSTLGMDFINYNIYADNPTSVNEWFLFTFVRESQTVTKLYVNGTLNKTNSSSYSKSGTEAYIQLGISGDSNYKYNQYKGYLASLRIYNRVLSSDQIAALYTQFTPEA